MLDSYVGTLVIISDRISDHILDQKLRIAQMVNVQIEHHPNIE